MERGGGGGVSRFIMFLNSETMDSSMSLWPRGSSSPCESSCAFAALHDGLLQWRIWRLPSKWTAMLGEQHHGGKCAFCAVTEAWARQWWLPQFANHRSDAWRAGRVLQSVHTLFEYHQDVRSAFFKWMTRQLLHNVNKTNQSSQESQKHSRQAAAVPKHDWFLRLGCMMDWVLANTFCQCFKVISSLLESAPDLVSRQHIPKSLMGSKFFLQLNYIKHHVSKSNIKRLALW